MRLITFIIINIVLIFLLIPISYSDSSTATSMAIAYQVGGGGYSTLCSNSNSNLIICLVGQESSPLSAIANAGEGDVDIRLEKVCEAGIGGGGTEYDTEVAYYNINWDTDSNDCIASGETWFDDLGQTLGSGQNCCGDDTTSDDFTTYSGILATSTVVSCRSCSDGIDSGTSSLYGNGYALNSACFYGNITCNGVDKQNGSNCTLGPLESCIDGLSCDNEFPKCSVEINGGDSISNDILVNLSLNYSDNRGVKDCAYSNNNNNWTSWTTCTENKIWTLQDQDGTQEVYYNLRDKAGYVTTSNDTIFVDRSELRIAINNNSLYTNVRDVKININLSNVIGDPQLCQYRNDNESYITWETCPNTPDPLYPEKNWTLRNEDGERTVYMNLDTSLGILAESSDTIIYDSTPPNGSIEIWALDVPGIHDANNEITAYITVNLIIEYSDYYGIEGCRLANKDRSFTPFEPCETIKVWRLDEIEGMKTVFLQITDNAGNIAEFNDTIYFNRSGAGLDTTPPFPAVVIDDGIWTNNNTTLHASWSGAYDQESKILNIPLEYNYSIGTSPGATNITGWTYVGTDTSMTKTGLNLDEGVTYYINVMVINSAGLTNVSSSDGITVDTMPCNIITLTSSTHDFGNWSIKSQSNEPEFNWNGDGGISGEFGYSYVLNTNPDSTGIDMIPEGNPNNFAGEKNVQYQDVIDGSIYFHVRCGDNAGNWGPVETKEIKIDTSKPSTPQITYRYVINDTGGNFTFNWTESIDTESNVKYQFELYNNSVFNSTYLVDIQNISYTNITIELLNDTEYYPRVMSWNEAYLNSSWSSNVSTIIDQKGPEIDIIIPHDLCPVATYSPVLRAITDEYASCNFRDINSATFSDIEYTKSEYHETQFNYLSTDLYNYNIKCKDIIGNDWERNWSFSVKGDSVPVEVESIGIAPRYYTGQIAELAVQLTTNHGGVSPNEFQIIFNGTNLTSEEYAITDTGCGNYTLSMAMPKEEGSYDIKVSIIGTSGITKTIEVVGLNLSISFESGEIGIGLDNLVYSLSGNTTFGIATESISPDINSTGGVINLISNSLEASTFIFASPESGRLKSTDKMLENREFSNKINPNFGSELIKTKYLISIKINYDSANLYSKIGNQSFTPGRYNLIINNNGLDQNTGKQKIELSIIG